jgi:hypothetical protein
MTAVRMYENGGLEVLKAETHPVSKSVDNEILMRVRSSSVRWWRLAYRTGRIMSIRAREALHMPLQLGRKADSNVVALAQMYGCSRSAIALS